MAARGYLGKISAVVAVNTSDARAQLSASAKDFTRYARSIQSTISGATSRAGRAFDDIFTPLQKVQRALQAASTERFALTSASDVTRVQQLVSAAEQLAKPLSSGVKQFSALSAEVQGEFQPALVRAQQQVELLRTAIDRFGSVSDAAFAGVQSRVDQTVQAMQRLVTAQNLANSGMTGQELTFRAPRVQDELTRSSQLSQQATAFSPALREDPSIRARIEELARLRQEIAQYQASVERRQVLGLDTREAQARLDDLLRRSSDARAAIEQISADAAAATRAFSTASAPREQRGLGLFGSQVGSDADRAIARAQEVSAAFARLPQSAQAGLAGLAGIASRVANGVQSGTSSASALSAVLDRLSQQIGIINAAQRAADNETAALIRREQAARQLEDQRAADAQRAADNEIALLQRREQAARQLEDQRAAAAQRAADNEIALLQRREQAARQLETERLARLDRERQAEEELSRARGNPSGRFGPDLPTGPSVQDSVRQMDALRSSVSAVKSQFDALPAVVRSRFIPAIQQADAELTRLAGSPAATAQEIENAANNVDQLAQSLRRAGQAASIPTFREFSNDLSTRQAIGELQALQQILAGIQAQAAGPAAQAYDRYRQRLQQAIETGTVGLPLVRRELVQLQRQAAEAAAATGRISAAAAFRTIQRGGDIGRQGFQNFSLAVNQAAFAIDDFFSATGGLEFKLRAVSNNVTQLAFILGNTTGLFIGLAAVITANVGIGIAKFVGALEDTREAQARANALTQALNGSLERQKQLVETLAEAYRNLAQEIRKSTAAPQNRGFVERQQQLQEIRGQQRDRRNEIVAGILPSIQQGRQRQTLIDERLQEPNVPMLERRRLQREARNIASREQNVVAGIDEAAGRLANQPIDRLREQRDSLSRRRDSIERDIARVGDGSPLRAGFEAQLEATSLALAEFTVAIQRYKDEAVASAQELAGPLVERIQAAQDRLSSAFGDTQIDAQTRLQTAGRQLADIVANATEGETGRRQVREQVTAVERQVRQVLDSVQALENFANALNDAAESAERTQQQSRQRVQELERDAAASPDDRGLQARLSDARQAAEAINRQRAGVETAVRGGRAAAAAGDTAGLRRQAEAATAGAVALESFAEDVQRRGDLLQRRSELAQRGFELIGGKSEEFAKQIVDAQRAIAAAQQAGADPQQAAAAMQRVADDVFRQAAPAVFAASAMRDQGPSRAALTVSDISTAEGARELGRLLRGDDPARDTNLAELKQQTSLLSSIKQDVARFGGIINVEN